MPDELIQAIREGCCVAFVGAGFVQPAVPGWKTLLKKLAAEIPDREARLEIEEWLKASSLTSREYEGLAESIEHALGKGFEAALRKEVSVAEGNRPERRLEILARLPFHTVLTTNFDELIRGRVPSPEVYANVLTAPRRGWWDGYYWKQHGHGRPPWVKLHGMVGPERAESLVFTTRSYRKLLHESPGYRAFLRALFSTHTVLYMGFSFTDAYINDIRSETLSMLGLRVGDGRGRDFAILNDVPEAAIRHLEGHEGLVVLDYSTRAEGRKTQDFSGFDRWLEAVYAEASPEASLQATVQGKKILWLDPNPYNNAYGVRILGQHADLVVVDSVEQALEKLRSARHDDRYDLIITRFGWERAGPSTCERLLTGMRSDDLRAPVIAFADPRYRERNRPVALELGALAFTDAWEELFEVMEGFFQDAGNRVRRSRARMARS